MASFHIGFAGDARSSRLGLGAVVAAAAVIGSSHAILAANWEPIGLVPGVNGPVSAMAAWDADGAGPGQPVLVVGGRFSVAGDIFANNIATWNGQRWSTLGDGVNVTNAFSLGVTALTVDSNGDLIVGGDFGTASGVTVNHVARWDGSAWHALGTGLASSSTIQVNAFHVNTAGDVIVGGAFSHAGGVAVNGVARWNGVAWSGIGGGVGGVQPVVSAVIEAPGGDLLIGGAFSSAGGVTATGVARWNGLAWSPVGTATSGGLPGVRVLKFMPDGQLIAGGTFAAAAGTPQTDGLARWDGASWRSMGTTSRFVYALAMPPGGDLIAGGFFSTAWGSGIRSVARWSGSQWTNMGDGVTQIGGSSAGEIRSFVVMPDGRLFAAGEFTKASGRTADHVAWWDGAQWQSLGTGLNVASMESAASSSISAIQHMPNGDLVVAGDLTLSADGTETAQVARWNGTEWSRLGLGVGGPVYALALMSSGELVAAGRFTAAGGVSANRVAKWNGTAWSPLGGGIVNGTVYCLLPLPNGHLIAGGLFSSGGTNISRWDGATWQPMGAGLGSTVNALAVLPGGDVIAGGLFSTADGMPASYVARWTGAAWTSMGGGLRYAVSALLVTSTGELIAGCRASPPLAGAGPRLARWTGVDWTVLGGAPNNIVVNDVAELSTGEIVVSGVGFEPVAGSAGNAIARWNGTTWLPLGNGVNSGPYVMEALPNGELVVGGAFFRAGDRPANRLALWTDRAGCRADLNSDGLVTVQDVFDFLFLWFSGDVRADIDASGTVSLQDLFTFLALYFQGCP